MSDDTPKLPKLVEAEMIEPARRAHVKLWKPGQSGNPSGQSKFYHRCREIARAAAPEMMEQLIHLAMTAQDERVKSVCLVAVLDRAGVKPMDFDPNTEKAVNSLDVSKLSPEQREQLRGLITLMNGKR